MTSQYSDLLPDSDEMLDYTFSFKKKIQIYGHSV